MTEQPVGSREFFDDLDEYRFDKLHYLPRLVDFSALPRAEVARSRLRHRHRSRALRARRCAWSPASICRRPRSIWRGRTSRCTASPRRSCGSPTARRLPFADASFDVVYGHGVVQYTADAPRLIRECHRVLRPGGEAIFMVYNRVSWLNALSKVMKVPLEHEDAPVLKKYSIAEFRRLLVAVSRACASCPSAFP